MRNAILIGGLVLIGALLAISQQKPKPVTNTIAVTDQSAIDDLAAKLKAVEELLALEREEARTVQGSLKAQIEHLKQNNQRYAAAPVCATCQAARRPQVNYQQRRWVPFWRR